VRRLILLMAAMGASVLLVSGVAYALTIQCGGAGDQDPNPGLCLGTQDDDEITGTNQPDVIRALGGFDYVSAGARPDELRGGDLGDDLYGDQGNDTYFGGDGADYLSEYGNFEDARSGADVMYGGDGPDSLQGNAGNDVLKGQAGDESEAGDPTDTVMFGDEGNDKLYGGTGDDAMEGEEDTDQHYGGPNNDFIDAAANESFATDAPDTVDCGDGIDTALVLPNDTVEGNCEQVFNVFPGNDLVAAASKGEVDADQRRLEERFREKRGG